MLLEEQLNAFQLIYDNNDIYYINNQTIMYQDNIYHINYIDIIKSYLNDALNNNFYNDYNDSIYRLSALMFFIIFKTNYVH